MILNISNTTVQNSTEFTQNRYFSDNWWHLTSSKLQSFQLTNVRKNILKIQIMSLRSNLPISHIVFIVCISVQLCVVCVLCVIAAPQHVVQRYRSIRISIDSMLYWSGILPNRGSCYLTSLKEIHSNLRAVKQSPSSDFMLEISQFKE